MKNNKHNKKRLSSLVLLLLLTVIMMSTATYAWFTANKTVTIESIDVNVHPQKREIKFDDEQKIFRLVYHAVLNTLTSQSAPDSIVKDMIKEPAHQVPLGTELDLSKVVVEDKQLGAHDIGLTEADGVVQKPQPSVPVQSSWNESFSSYGNFHLHSGL